jgi:hypothetical protein
VPQNLTDGLTVMQQTSGPGVAAEHPAQVLLPLRRLPGYNGLLQL